MIGGWGVVRKAGDVASYVSTGDLLGTDERESSHALAYFHET
jgi:hypothetical protein